MRRFLPILLVFLALVSPCQGFKQSNEIADITYLLRCWPTVLSVANQSYVSGQVIDNATEGCLVGSLTVFGTGSLLSSGNLLISPTTTDYVYSGAVTKSLGLASFFHLITGSLSANPGGPEVGFKSTISGSYANCVYCVHYDGASGYQFLYGQSLFDSPTVTPYANSTTYKYVIVLGGYNSSEIPYKVGDTKSSFSYGATLFINAGAGWNLAQKTSLSNTTTLYYVLANYNLHNISGSNILIPNYDFSSVLQPTHLSLFGTNGELSDYTPDVGSVWTEQTGDWDTSSGKVVNTTAGIATFDPALTTGMYDVTVTMPASGTTAGGLVARYTDSSNYWYVALSVGSSNNVVLNEDSGGSVTSRSTASATLNASTAYAVRLIVSSTSPYWTTYIAGVAKNSYATVGSQSTSTKFGLYDGGDINMTGFDVVGFWPLTSATYTSEFAKVGY